MSSAAPERPHPIPEWDRLELVVRRLLDELDGWRRRAVASEKRVQQLERALREVASGKLDPRALNAELEAVRAENRQLRERIAAAREGVERIAGRIEFLAEEAR